MILVCVALSLKCLWVIHMGASHEFSDIRFGAGDKSAESHQQVVDH